MDKQSQTVILGIVLVFSLLLNVVQFYQYQMAGTGDTPGLLDSGDSDDTGSGGASEGAVEEAAVDVSSKGFTNYDPPELAEGEVRLRNYGDTALDGTAFTLHFNGEAVDTDGCKNRDTVPPQYTCVLNFYEWCGGGDVLEVRYDGGQVLVRNC